MAASIRDSLLGYLAVLDRRVIDTGKSTPLYLSGGAAVVLAYGSTERTKDVDAFVAERNEVLDELQAWAGKNTVIAKREGISSKSCRRSTPWRRACSIGHCRSKV